MQTCILHQQPKQNQSNQHFHNCECLVIVIHTAKITRRPKQDAHTHYFVWFVWILGPTTTTSVLFLLSSRKCLVIQHLIPSIRLMIGYVVFLYGDTQWDHVQIKENWTKEWTLGDTRDNSRSLDLKLPNETHKNFCLIVRR